VVNYDQFYSNNAKGMKRSEIRELLKLTARPGIISFAGGLPAPDLFPIEDIKEISRIVMEREGKTALQYGPTEGDNRLREELADDPVGGLLAMPVSDTVKRATAAGAVAETVPREGLWLAQTPQMFRFALLIAAPACGPH